MTDILDCLQNGLIASCQPVDGGPMDTPETIAAMACAAVAGGAHGLRIEGVENLALVRRHVDVPIIGIVKAARPETSARITITIDDALALIEAGADIVAYDATDRPRQDSPERVLQAIQSAGAIAMADCSTLADGQRAKQGGAAILGTTLSGYTSETRSSDPRPDFQLIRSFAQLSAFVMAEGRFNTPDLARQALQAGADAVTVGTALTRLEVNTSSFANAVSSAGEPQRSRGFAIDLGGTKTAAALIENGQILQRLQVATDGAATPEGHIANMSDLLQQLGHKKGDRLGVAVTGRVDRPGNWHAVNTHTLTAVQAVPLAHQLANRFGHAVVINDAAAATLAEHRLGAGRGQEDFAYITVSTGVAGGLVLQGNLLASDNGLAGHFGFASSRLGEHLCGSGRLGTVESVASGIAIARAAQAHDFTGSARDVFDQAAAGADWADRLIETSAQAIAELSADLAAIAGVDLIAIGGSIGLADGYLDRVRQQIGVLPTLFQTTIVPAELSTESPLLGAWLAADGDTS